MSGATRSPPASDPLQGTLFASGLPADDKGGEDEGSPAAALFEGGDVDPKREPPATITGSTGGKPPPPSDGDVPPDDLRRPRRFVRMAPPGIRPRPAKWTPPLSRDLKLAIPPGTSRAKRFSVALDALIAEMKETGVGDRRIPLEDGNATDLGTDTFGYAFDFLEDAEVFSEARVEVQLGNRRIPGSVVSVSAGKITLALEANLGPRINSCVLLIDNTALLIALKDRLDEVDAGKLSLNVGLADAVFATGDKAPEAPELAELADSRVPLNQVQRAAVRSTLRRSVCFIWGPPGTGKTTTLAALVEALYAAGKRVLVCSNTNRAVDEVLVRLCRHLGRDHAAFAQGHVLRQGRTKAEDLGGSADLLLLDNIVARLSGDLRLQMVALQNRLVETERSLERVGGVLRLFVQFDEAVKRSTTLTGALVDAKADENAATQEKRDADDAVSRAKSGLDARLRAGPLRRMMMPSELRLQERIDSATRSLSTCDQRARKAAAARAEVAGAVAAQESWQATLRERLRPYDRRRLTTEQQTLEGERASLREELGRIQAQLADIERSVLKSARIIGTTITRAYLSSKDYGAFDAVVVDEASMILLPALYIACGLARERLTVSGDFHQLPPIVQSQQEAILDEIGSDVFRSAGLKRECLDGQATNRIVMLDTQRRMVEPICALVRGAMNYKQLRTGELAGRKANDPRPPAPFDQSLTVVDTSRLWPFECRTLFYSRFNLMHALLIRNLCSHLAARGFLIDDKSIGVCTPYAAQAKVTHAILADEGLGGQISASTVHRYQGDEKRMMILDIPESIGSGFGLGRFIQAHAEDDDGARLLNVAISRAMDHLVVFANVTYLDSKLPSLAKLRYCVYEMERVGTVVDAQDVLGFRPFSPDALLYGTDAKIEWDASQAGQFRAEGFDRVFRLDVQRAKRSVAIFSGYITEAGAARYGDLLRSKIGEGVAVRCVTRPPRYNGTMDLAASKRALDALEGIGVIVDTRKAIHQKVCIIDDEIVWLGSLNALSHTANTDEVMVRSSAPAFASSLASLLSVAPIRVPEGTSPWVVKENPGCGGCGARTYFAKGKYGPYFKCEDCGWSRSLYGQARRGRQRGAD